MKTIMCALVMASLLLILVGHKDAASDKVLWTADGVPICTAANDQLYAQLVSDGSGGAIITWDDWRNYPESRDIYAQRG